VDFNPHPYQRLIIDFILDHPRCNVHAQMGVGKSVSTATAIDLLFATGQLTGPVLIVAPLRVANHTWPAEFAKWDHLANLGVSVVTGSIKQRLAALHKKADVYITNYENLPWLREQFA
jgi:SNF2 family DNA or RNA helicase